jgi:outer membrane receptor protein involved in Fe transport
VSAGVESDWSPAFRTKLAAAVEEVHDAPLYSDPFMTGIGRLTYGGKTRILSFRAEGFAKFTPNDYVGMTLVVRSSENTATKLQVPYLPTVEAVGTYTHAFPFGAVAAVQVLYQGQRETDLVVSQKLAGFFLVDLGAEYDLFSSFKLFLKLQNITNKRYELWKGYQAPPFLFSAGASFRW